MVQDVYSTLYVYQGSLFVDLSNHSYFIHECMLLFYSHLSWIYYNFFPTILISTIHGAMLLFSLLKAIKKIHTYYISFITYHSCDFIALYIACGCLLPNAAAAAAASVFSLEMRTMNELFHFCRNL